MTDDPPDDPPDDPQGDELMSEPDEFLPLHLSQGFGLFASCVGLMLEAWGGERDFADIEATRMAGNQIQFLFNPRTRVARLRLQRSDAWSRATPGIPPGHA